MPDLIDPFHRALHQTLVGEIERRMGELAGGSAAAINDSPGTVAEKYAAQVSYIQALNNVLDKCAEIEREIYGNRSDGGN